jgi:heme A synthase
MKAITTVRQPSLRLTGVALLVSPLLLAYPLFYWAFNLAGTWFVTTRLLPEQRVIHLRFAYVMLMTMVVGLTCFWGLLLVYLGGYKRQVIGWLLIPSGLLLLLGAFLAFFMIASYIKFS